MAVKGMYLKFDDAAIDATSANIVDEDEETVMSNTVIHSIGNGCKTIQFKGLISVESYVQLVRDFCTHCF